MNRVLHFELQASDPKRASEFYNQVFNWKINEFEVPGADIPDENRYWLIDTGPSESPGINGGLMLRRGNPPVDEQAVNAYVCIIEVANIDESLQKSESAGGVITVPKMPIKGIGWVAYCKDTEGNIFGMMQNDDGV